MKLRNNGIIEKREYVGKTLEKANEYAEAGGFITRIVEKDGNAFVLTMDVKTNRLNFRIKNDKVIDVFGG